MLVLFAKTACKMHMSIYCHLDQVSICFHGVPSIGGNNCVWKYVFEKKKRDYWEVQSDI